MVRARILKRVLAEVEDVNADFFNLRTVIRQDDDDDSHFYYIMLPNDGALAHLPLVGSFWIPAAYPAEPPGVQLYTKTLRPNVDMYRFNFSGTRSTMCFDILQSRRYGGTWKPEYSLSCLFASLMSAIVSFYVAQSDGPGRIGAVSMESLRQVREDARQYFDQFKHLMPPVPRIPLVEAKPVPAKTLWFPRVIVAGRPELITSDPIFLQTGYDELHSFAVDLSGLHDQVIFSVILSSSLSDISGEESDTVLVRNGVTATAARKRAGERTRWFYHGRPMNDGDMQLHVTVGRDQMTLAYFADGSRYVHGDCPVSLLTKDHIGHVRGVPFYIHIYTKDKTARKGKPAEGVKIPVLDIQGQGYIHDPENLNVDGD